MIGGLQQPDDADAGGGVGERRAARGNRVGELLRDERQRFAPIEFWRVHVAGTIRHQNLAACLVVVDAEIGVEIDAFVVDADLLAGIGVVVNQHALTAAEQHLSDFDRREPVHMKVREETAVKVHRDVRHVFAIEAGEGGAVCGDRDGPGVDQVVHDRQIVRGQIPDDVAVLLEQSEIDANRVQIEQLAQLPRVDQPANGANGTSIDERVIDHQPDAALLGELAEKRGVRLMVDHTFVYTGAVRAIRGLVDAGQLGELLYLDSVRVNLGLFQQDSNVIWDLATHDLSIMDYLVDARPVAVSADGTALAGFDRENVAYVTVHFDSGFLAHFHVNWLAPVKIRQMLLGGRQRMLVYDDTDPSEKVRVYDKGVDFDADFRVDDDQTRRQILVSYRTGDMHAPKLDRREALALVAQEFADAIAARRAPLTDAAAGVRVVRLLEAADQSLRSQGQRIRV